MTNLDQHLTIMRIRDSIAVVELPRHDTRVNSQARRQALNLGFRKQRLNSQDEVVEFILRNGKAGRKLICESFNIRFLA